MHFLAVDKLFQRFHVLLVVYWSCMAFPVFLTIHSLQNYENTKTLNYVQKVPAVRSYNCISLIVDVVILYCESGGK